MKLAAFLPPPQVSSLARLRGAAAIHQPLASHRRLLPVSLPVHQSRFNSSSSSSPKPPQLTRPAFSLTLALLKPDIYADPITVAAVHAQLPASGLELVRSRRVHWSTREAGAFYAEHHGKFFYDRLSSYMTSGPFLAMILRSTAADQGSAAAADAITRWREVIGPTHPVRAQVVAPSSLRGQFGLTDTRNSFHGSDSIETAVRELDFFFPKDPAVETYLASFRAAHPGIV